MIGYTVIGLAIALGMPALQSYVSARSQYEQRARMLGVLELSWALSALLGVPLATIIAEQLSIGTVFGLLALAGVVTIGLYAILPGDPPVSATLRAAGSQTYDMGAVFRQTAVLAALGVIFIQLAAVELIFVSYAGWLSSAFGVTTTELGLVFALLGLVELVGSLAATLFTDRIGKRRAVLTGFTLVGCWLLLLPFSGTWPIFLVVLLAFDLCFEFAIVSVFPLVSGLSVRSRGAILALMTACIGGGRVLGSLAGPWISATAGYTMNSILAGGLVFLGVGLGILFMREGRF